MKILLIGGLVFGFASLAFGEMKMVEAEALAKEKNVDVIIIDKKDLNKYVKEKSKTEVPTESHPFLSETVVIDAGAAVVPEMKREKIIVDGFESFKSALLLGNSKEIEIEYKFNLQSGLKIVKYIFANNMKNRYPDVKAVLLVEAKKHPTLDYESFRVALDDLNEATVDLMIVELGGV
ncbi:MAG: hypothetical protein PHO62_07780 [Sulfurimonas sp.]|uniref:hypothetical protein n=1 Tax=Sulfurimonas sp. TaxID=2022749 RepID=UPI00260EB7E9|nr:hypothetical protein [Sulfurimonas sp.]MDD5373306.1 hypothetical protein [Sulfurimonas sp.]